MTVVLMRTRAGARLLPVRLLLGGAVGSAFAVLLLVHGGHLAPVTRVLVLRAAAPGGHAAWTGLACAALFAIRGSRRADWAWARFGFVFAGVSPRQQTVSR